MLPLLFVSFVSPSTISTAQLEGRIKVLLLTAFTKYFRREVLIYMDTFCCPYISKNFWCFPSVGVISSSVKGSCCSLLSQCRSSEEDEFPHEGLSNNIMQVVLLISEE